MANKSKKELKDRLALLAVFESNLKIMEFELLEKMQRYLALYRSNLFGLVQNMSVLENISKRWVNNEGSFFASNKSESTDKLPNLYVLVGPAKIDKFTYALLDKLNEKMSIEYKPSDYIVTVGDQVNFLARNLNLSIINHFPISVVEDHFDFLEKISSIFRILTSKGLVKDSYVVYAENEIGSEKLLQQHILPIEINDWKVKLDKNEGLHQISKQNPILESIYSKSVSEDATWFPSIADVNAYLIDLIIKLKLDMVSNKNKYRFYEREYQLLQSKKDKIQDNKKQIKLDLNKIRKEEITNDIIVLASAFKSQHRDEENEEGGGDF